MSCTVRLPVAASTLAALAVTGLGTWLTLSAPPPQTFEARVTTSVGQVCLDVAQQGATCLSRGHIDHLDVDWAQPGDCVQLENAGPDVAAATVRSVRPGTCAD